jgi:type I restriction enzyme S subunit
MSLGYIGEPLPKEWCSPLLTDLATPKQWKTISTKELLSSGYTVYGANGKIGHFDRYTHEYPTIMITCRGATCGNLHISEPFSYINGNAMALDWQPTELVGLRFLYFALKARGLDDTISGSAQPQITGKGLAEVRLPLPPLAEQKVIADKLDTLLAQVENTKARLERIPKILKRFRQSVLAAAVSGRLTDEWRNGVQVPSIHGLLEKWKSEREKLKSEKLLKKSFGPKSDPSPIIEGVPENWAWVNFDHIAEHSNNALKAGPFGSALKKSDCVEKGFKVYGQEQVIAGNERLVTYYVNPQKFEHLNACSIKPGDILISLVGTIGKVLVLSQEAEAGIINPRLVKLSIQEDINKSFVDLYLGSPVAHDFFRGFSHGGTMEILNLSILKELPIPLPPLEEQTEIVRQVDQLFAHADRIEQQVNNALARVNNLTQSILAKAFRGELTEQWRNENQALIGGENSAAALLEMIKSERAAVKPVKKTRSKRTTV